MSESKATREPVLNDVRNNLITIDKLALDVKIEVEVVHDILDKDVFAKNVSKLQNTEGSPSEPKVPNLRFDMSTYAKNVIGILESTIKSLHSLQSKLREDVSKVPSS